MAKRLSVLLFVLILLLSACSRNGNPVGTNPTPTPSSETSALNPTGTEAPVETDPLPPPETEAPQPPEESHSASVTAGGYRVEIDSSQYSPYQPPEEKYIRPEGVDLSEFHPENATGKVYPYVSSLLYSSDGVYGYRYGFFDSTGTLVTDGIYTECNPMVMYDYDSDYYTASCNYPLWSVGRPGDIRMVHYEDEDYSYDYPEGNILYGVVAMDGSFSIPCEFVSVNAREDRIICCRSYSTNDYAVYDLQGNLVLTSSKLFTQPADWTYFDYGDGLYLVAFCYNDYANEMYFCNAAGERILGPYTGADSFTNGLAPVSTDGKYFGYIDKSGSWVIPPRYTYCGTFRDGRAIVRIGEDTNAVIDQNGRELLRSDEGWFSRTKCGFEHYTEDGFCAFYDLDGNELLSGYGQWACLSETIFYKRQGDDVILHSLDDSIPDLTVPGVTYMQSGMVFYDGQVRKGFYNNDYPFDTVYYVPEDLSEYVALEQTDRRTGDSTVYENADQMTGETYYIFWEDSQWGILNASFELLSVKSREYPIIFDGLIRNVGELACTYRNLEGELIFSFPYTDGGD